MRWVPFVVPLVLAIAAIVDFDELHQAGPALPFLVGIGVVAVVAAELGERAARAGRPRSLGTFVLCWIVAALAITRVAVELAWYGAHATLDFDAVTHELIGTWLTLAIGVTCAIAGIVVGRPRARE